MTTNLTAQYRLWREQEILHVVAVEAVRPYVLDVTFNNRVRRVVDVEQHLWGPTFEAVRDPAVFMRARLDPEVSTVAWPNDADLAPEGLLESPEAAANPREVHTAAAVQAATISLHS